MVSVLALDARIPILLIGICLSGIALVFLVWVLSSGRLRADRDDSEGSKTETPVDTDG